MISNFLKSLFLNKEPAQQDILGIDISHSYVRIVQLVKKKKQWLLFKVASKSLDETYESFEKKQEAIVSLLKNIKLEQIKIDPRLIEERFITSTGPGGQNVNKVATAVELRFDLGACVTLGAAVQLRLKKLAGIK